ncbi:MAG: hypothetical protein AAFR44_08575, partial [Pseudomonadota bacterium]
RANQHLWRPGWVAHKDDGGCIADNRLGHGGTIAQLCPPARDLETFFDGTAGGLRLISIRDAKSRCPTMKTE